jgi:hypothetical protein
MISKLKPAEVIIPQENPFANDKLDRQKCAEALTNLMQNIPGPIVVSINGAWGTGKTVFLKMFRQRLQNNGFTTIYFSAWEDDYCSDALVALTGHIWSSLKDSDYREIVTSVKDCIAPIIRNTIFNATRTLTAGVVDLNEEQLKSASEKAVDEYLAAGERLKDLKQRLAKLAQKISENGKQLIIIIDELGRCRPVFAIEVLEKLKHLFDIPGILFILGIDREQLGHSVKSIYGHDMDVNGYLRRFIDMEFILPEANPEVFCSHLFEQFGLSGYFQKRRESSRGRLDEKDRVNMLFAKLCACFKLSLRDIEHCFRLFSFACANTPENYFLHPDLLAVLVILKLENSKLYHDYVMGNCNGTKVVDFILEQTSGADFFASRIGNIVEAHLYAASPKSWRGAAYCQMQRLFEKKELLQPEYLTDRIKTMPHDKLENLFSAWSSLQDRFEGEISEHTLGYLSKKIELASLMLGYRE